jgi:ATP-dependent HslUV protease, peptidase subunit HslV
MSIALAVKKKGKVVIGADTQLTFGSNTPCKGNTNELKYLKVGDSYIANTGWGIYFDIFEDFSKDFKDAEFNNKNSVFTFFVKLWHILHEKYSFVNDQCDSKNSPFADLDSSFLIANKNKIFYISGNLSVTEFNKFHAIGSGSDFAIGAMYAVYDQNKSAMDIARTGIEAAIAHNIYCGGKIKVVEL